MIEGSLGLSTVDYPRQEMGERVLSLLQDRITDPTPLPARSPWLPG